jgi:hypothetical protein
MLTSGRLRFLAPQNDQRVPVDLPSITYLYPRCWRGHKIYLLQTRQNKKRKVATVTSGLIGCVRLRHHPIRSGGQIPPRIVGVVRDRICDRGGITARRVGNLIFEIAGIFRGGLCSLVEAFSKPRGAAARHAGRVCRLSTIVALTAHRRAGRHRVPRTSAGPHWQCATRSQQEKRLGLTSGGSTNRWSWNTWLVLIADKSSRLLPGGVDGLVELSGAPCRREVLGTARSAVIKRECSRRH